MTVEFPKFPGEVLEKSESRSAKKYAGPARDSYEEAREAFDAMSTSRNANESAVAEVEDGETANPKVLAYRERRDAIENKRDEVETAMEERRAAFEAELKAEFADALNLIETSDAKLKVHRDETIAEVLAEKLSGINTADLSARYVEARDDLAHYVKQIRKTEESFPELKLPTLQQAQKGHVGTTSTEKAESATWRPRFDHIYFNGEPVTPATTTGLSRVSKISVSALQQKIAEAAGGRYNGSEWERVVDNDGGLNVHPFEFNGQEVRIRVHPSIPAKSE